MHQPANASTCRTQVRQALLFVLVSGLLALPGLAQIERAFEVGAGGSLRLNAAGASVTVDAKGGNEVSVLVERRRGTEPIEKDFDVSMEQSGSSVIVKIEKRNKVTWGRNSGLKVSVSLPSRYDIDIATSGGSLSVSDLEGEVLVRTSGGSITLGRIQGRVDAATSGGSITLASSTVTADLSTSGGSIKVGDVSGSINVRTSGGSVTIQRADGDVMASTSGGSITLGEIAGAINASTSGGSVTAEFTSQPTADSKLSTSGGSVRVKLAQGLGFDLDARSSSGISSDVPIEVRGKIERRRLQGKVNGGGPSLVLRASGGKVVISES